MGASRQTAGKWLHRSRSGEGLFDRSSRPRRLARLTPPDVEERVCAAFMGRCLQFFEDMGVRVDRVMTDNGPGYRSGEFNALPGPPGPGTCTQGRTARGKTARSSA